MGNNLLDPVRMGIGAWSWGDRVVWQFGRGYGPREIRGAFEAAKAEGIAFIDTAEIYGSGRSERFVGEFLRTSDAAMLVGTKFFPWPWRLRRGSIKAALAASLTRLGLREVDLYQIHSPVSPMSPEEMAEGLLDCIDSGMTRTVGVSNFDEGRMLRVYSTLARHRVALTSNQVHYSLVRRQVEKDGLLARCQELDIRLVAHSPLEMGLLTGKYGSGHAPPGSRALRYVGMLDRLEPLLRTLTEIGQDVGGKSNSQVALNWVMAKGALPIPGAKTAEQSQENAGALGWSLTAQQVQALDEASDTINK